MHKIPVWLDNGQARTTPDFLMCAMRSLAGKEERRYIIVLTIELAAEVVAVIQVLRNR